jgi:succinyl-CoA synthetase alpha subunit
MAILINNDTKVMIQGITGSQGSLHAKYMLEYGVDLVCGVTPGKGVRKYTAYRYLIRLQKL